MKTKLTRDESRHLLDLGVPKENASSIDIDVNNFDYMLLLAAEAIGNGNGDKTIRSLSSPIFEVEDFLNGKILPKEVRSEGLKAYFYQQWYEGKWYVGYSGEAWVPEFQAEELIDALYELTCWYFKKQKK